MVDRALHRLPALSSWTGGILTPVISSQVPHHRLHSPAPRGPLHGPLVAGCIRHCDSLVFKKGLGSSPITEQQLA